MTATTASARIATLDFETDAIEARPLYPPRPVGFSLKMPGWRQSRYYAWGHPSGNNTSYEEARNVLAALWDSDTPILCHNTKFDYDVAVTRMGLPELDWSRLHDTLYLLFLADPHAASLSLKPSAERLLDMPPEEQDAVRNWLIEHGVVRKNDSRWGAHISKAPGDIVGRYANGDVLRTEKLFNLLGPQISRDGMVEAYNRERRLMPILLRNEREGIRIDAARLEADLAMYEAADERVCAWIRKRLKAPELNIESDVELAEALARADVVREWKLTPTGQRSVSKKNLLPSQFADKRLAAAIGYHTRIQTCMKTFMKRWLQMASEGSGERIFTNWNQVRTSGSKGDDFSGARTGRLSSSPNFQNIPKTFEDKNDGYAHPSHIPHITELPLMRRYILPDKGQVFMHRDYNQQELRILAHFEDDALLSAYRENPELDVHNFVRDEIERIGGQKLERRETKILNFGMIYGMGFGALAGGLQTTVEEARSIKKAQRAAMPGLAELEKSVKAIGQSGEPIRTWGGRLYYTEQPVIINGERREFSYKLLNYLIQGSASDCTKEAIIRYDAEPREARFLVTVHDEINASSPKGALRKEMSTLRRVMESIEFDIPMLSDAKVGPSWGELTKYEEKR